MVAVVVVKLEALGRGGLLRDISWKEGGECCKRLAEGSSSISSTLALSNIDGGLETAESKAR